MFVSMSVSMSVSVFVSFVRKVCQRFCVCTYVGLYSQSVCLRVGCDPKNIQRMVPA